MAKNILRKRSEEKRQEKNPALRDRVSIFNLDGTGLIPGGRFHPPVGEGCVSQPIGGGEGEKEDTPPRGYQIRTVGEEKKGEKKAGSLTGRGKRKGEESRPITTFSSRVAEQGRKN